MLARNMHVSTQLRIVPWDGYLKYYNLGEKHPQLIEKRRRVLADTLRRYLTARVRLACCACFATLAASWRTGCGAT